MRFSSLPILVLTGSALLLSACGGGGGDTTAPVPLSGTVAVGAPLANADVSIKGANGGTASAITDANGDYTADIAGLTAPFMVRASGLSAGVPTELFSVATSATATLNVTPLTTALTTQVLGTAPAQAFEQASAIAAVNATTLNLAKTRLVQALEDVLVQLGKTPANVDPFTTPFRADNTGLDKLLDLVAFETSAVSPGGPMLIQDKSSGRSVAFQASASAPVALPALDTAIVSLDTSGIRVAIAQANAALQSGGAAALLPFLHPDFVLEGQGPTAFLADEETAELLGQARFTDFVLSGCTSDGVCAGTLGVRFGDESDSLFFTFKQDNGVWKLYGDRKPFEYELKPVVFTRQTGDTTNVLSGFNFYVPSDLDIANQAVHRIELFVVTDGTSTLPNEPSVILDAPRGEVQAGVASTPTNNCRNDGYMILRSDSGLCGNFGSVSDQRAAEFNTAAQQGLLRIFIKAFDANGDMLLNAPHEIMQRIRLMNQAEAEAAAANSGITVNRAGFGTANIGFTVPSRYRDLTVVATYQGANQWGQARWEDNEARALNGLITREKARAQSCADSPNRQACEQGFPADGVVTNLNLYTHQPNLGLWFEYSPTLGSL